MKPSGNWSTAFWQQVVPKLLPFADAATPELPLGRLLRLSLFQVSVGMAVVLLNGTLNRVMIVEMGMATWLVSLMISLPLLFAPFRVLVGFRSDTHRSMLGWRRVPYIWLGTMLQFGGLAIMPFALILLSGDTTGPAFVGQAGAALAFLMVGAGLHTTQTAGLALATDLAPAESRHRVVALLYVMLLVGMVTTSACFGWLLDNFSQLRLIQVIQGAAALTMALNVVALWKQEVRDPSRTAHDRARPSFGETWRTFAANGQAGRFLFTVALGTAGFSMQDILLEPYGAEVLGLTVGATTMLTALLAGGTLAGFGLSARMLGRGGDPYRLCALGALIGVAALSAVIFAAPLESALLFRTGTVFIGFGAALFGVGSLCAAMNMVEDRQSGIALGAWGAVQATAAGLSIAFAGAIRDGVASLADAGILGPALTGPAVGYCVVYHIEIGLLFLCLAAIGPLVRSARTEVSWSTSKFGVAEFPG